MFEEEQLIAFLNWYDCFKDNKDKKTFVIKEQYKTKAQELDLKLKINIPTNFEIAINSLPLTKEQAKTREQIVKENKFSSNNWLSACLSLNSVSPFNKYTFEKDIKKTPNTYYCSKLTNAIKDKLNNATLLEQKEQ